MARGHRGELHAFGGLRAPCSGDNSARVGARRDRATGTVSFHPSTWPSVADWDVQPARVRAVSRADKGKTEAGVKYVKRNGWLISRSTRSARSSSTGEVDDESPISGARHHP